MKSTQDKIVEQSQRAARCVVVLSSVHNLHRANQLYSASMDGLPVTCGNSQAWMGVGGGGGQGKVVVRPKTRKNHAENTKTTRKQFGFIIQDNIKNSNDAPTVVAVVVLTRAFLPLPPPSVPGRELSKILSSRVQDGKVCMSSSLPSL